MVLAPQSITSRRDSRESSIIVPPGFDVSSRTRGSRPTETRTAAPASPGAACGHAQQPLLTLTIYSQCQLISPEGKGRIAHIILGIFFEAGRLRLHPHAVAFAITTLACRPGHWCVCRCLLL